MTYISPDIKALVFDIETSLMLTSQFSLYGNDYTPHDQIVQDWYLICAAWQWVGQKEVHGVSQLDDKKAYKKDTTADYIVAKTLHDTLSEADLLIGHNIDKFDLRRLNTRFSFHGLGPIPKIRTADTYKIAKREFAFPSYRLDYIARFFEVGQKLDTGGGGKNLWVRALTGDQEAIEKMMKYCAQDVKINTEVYLKLRPFDRLHPNLSIYVNDIKEGEMRCPKCGSTELTKYGTRSTSMAATGSGLFQRYKCGGCGGIARGRRNLLAKKETGIAIADRTVVSH